MSTHEAGRELDALVAQKVMGWEVRDEFFMDGDPAGQIVYDGAGRGRGGPGEGWSPSKRIEQAWEVVELFPETGRGLHLMQSMARGGRWRCTFDMGEGDWGDTAPHAICLAALKSMEGGE